MNSCRHLLTAFSLTLPFRISGQGSPGSTLTPLASRQAVAPFGSSRSRGTGSYATLLYSLALPQPLPRPSSFGLLRWLHRASLHSMFARLAQRVHPPMADDYNSTFPWSRFNGLVQPNPFLGGRCYWPSRRLLLIHSGSLRASRTRNTITSFPETL